MAASQGGIGKNSKVEVETTLGAGDWFKLGEVGDIPLPDETVDDVDITHQDSPDDAYEFVPGLTQYGEMQLPLNWIPGNPTETYYHTWKAARERRTVRITAPNGQAYAGLMYPRTLSRVLPLKDKMAATMTFKSGGPFLPL